MTPCTLGGSAARCGVLRVPEDPSAASGRVIELRIVVVPAVSAHPRPDPLVLLAGGPGGAATETLAWAPGTFAAVHADRDMVFVDQRGTGGSNRLILRPLLLEGLPDEEIARLVDAALAALPGDPRFYTTFVAMEDLEAVRAALGYDVIDLFGASYGATAAQYYLKQHPDRVRSVVLDGATLLDVPVFERLAASSARALDMAFDRCAADSECRAAYPELRSEFTNVIDRLTSAPVTATVADPATGRPMVIDLGTFASVIHGALVDARSANDLRLLVHSAFIGDWDHVARAALSNAASAGSELLVMAAVIRCSEAWARFDRAQVAALPESYARSWMIGAAISQARTCRFAPRGVVAPNDADPVRSAVPALLIVGDADPQDPPGNIADAAVDLPNSRTVIVPDQGHTVGHLGCMPAVIAAFIEAGRAEGLDLSCVAGGAQFHTAPPP
jgi:pimeloyl-ACP methyl ester carboxylesterase